MGDYRYVKLKPANMGFKFLGMIHPNANRCWAMPSTP